jgi:hypothetical protein
MASAARSAQARHARASAARPDGFPPQPAHGQEARAEGNREGSQDQPRHQAEGEQWPRQHPVHPQRPLGSEMQQPGEARRHRQEEGDRQDHRVQQRAVDAVGVHDDRADHDRGAQGDREQPEPRSAMRRPSSTISCVIRSPALVADPPDSGRRHGAARPERAISGVAWRLGTRTRRQYCVVAW